MVTNIISGYFAAAGLPQGLSSHSGYIDYFSGAIQHNNPDKLIVIVQSDTMQRKKYGFAALPVFDIVKGIQNWYNSLEISKPALYIIINRKPTISKTLKKIRKSLPDDELYLIKDSDRNIENMPADELSALFDNDIKYIYLGNEKKASSGILIGAVKSE